MSLKDFDTDQVQIFKCFQPCVLRLKKTQQNSKRRTDGRKPTFQTSYSTITFTKVSKYIVSSLEHNKFIKILVSKERWVSGRLFVQRPVIKLIEHIWNPLKTGYLWGWSTSESPLERTNDAGKCFPVTTSLCVVRWRILVSKSIYAVNS